MDWNLKTYDGVVVGEYIWFSNNSFNGLFRMNISNDSIEYIGSFPGEDMLQNGLHKKCFLFCNFLFFLPAKSKYVHIFDLSSYKFESIMMDADDSEKIADAVMIGEKIFMFSMYLRKCYRLDLRELSIECVPEFDYEIEKCGILLDKMFITRCSVIEKNKICFAFYNTDVLAQWDVDDNKLIICHTGIDHIFSAHVINDKIWIIVCEGSNIYSCSFGGSPQNFSSDALLKEGKKCRFYSRITKFQEDIIGIPAFSNEIVYLRDECFAAVAGDEWNLTDPVFPAFLSVLDMNRELWMLPFSADAIYVYDKESNLVTRKEFVLTDTEMRRRILAKQHKEIMSNKIVYENTDFSLDEFMDVLLYGQADSFYNVPYPSIGMLIKQNVFGA